MPAASATGARDASPASTSNTRDANPASATDTPDTSPASTTTSAPAPTGLTSWLTELPPAAGSAAMATAIVSIGLRSAGASVLSAVTFALAALAWVGLAGDFGLRLVGQRERWVAEAHTPPALTAVAATTVLGVRVSLAGWHAVAAGLLAVAVLLWPPLLWSVLRRLRPHMQGAVFLVCVATQGLVTLGATLASALPARWLLGPAVVVFGLGLVLYVDAMFHFDVAAVRNGAGDHWVAGGALAISALAGAKLVEAGRWVGGGHSVLRAITLVLLGLAWAWYVVLVVAEIRWPRVRYDVRRWATIFPMGMTAVATVEVAKAGGWGWLTGVGHVLVWVGAAAWLVVFAGLVRKGAGLLRRGNRA